MLLWRKISCWFFSEWEYDVQQGSSGGFSHGRKLKLHELHENIKSMKADNANTMSAKATRNNKLKVKEHKISCGRKSFEGWYCLCRAEFLRQITPQSKDLWQQKPSLSLWDTGIVIRYGKVPACRGPRATSRLIRNFKRKITMGEIMHDL